MSGPADPLNPELPAGTTLVVGRSPDCDIFVPHPRVSAKHARITVLEDGRLRVVDEGSSNGTFLGDVTRSVQETEIEAGEVLFLSMEFSIKAGELLRWRKRPDSPASPDHIRIGRDSSNDVVINRLSVAPFHAWLGVEAPRGPWLRDLGSHGGTFVDDAAVDGRGVLVGNETKIRFGKVELSVAEILGRIASGQRRIGFEREAIQIDARGLCLESGGRRILDQIDFLVSPGELVGIMGPSGCGKTTLLRLLAGAMAPTRGEILFNGHSLTEHRRRFLPLIGYVPQEDELPPELTPRELLLSHGRIRSNLPFPRADLATRISALLSELGLDAETTADRPIRNPGAGGLSGGQRKRLSLALELMSEPALLLLDEPTSGLSSRDAREVMERVATVAAGREIPVVFSLHQPSRKLFRDLNRIILLQEGRLAFFGLPHPDAPSHLLPGRNFDAISPEDLIERLDERSGEEWAVEFREGSGKSLYEQRIDLQRQPPSSAAGPEENPVRRVLWPRQAAVLLGRHFKETFRDRESLAYLFLQAPFLGAFVSVLFSSGTLKDQVSWYFLTTAVAFWLGISHAVREIVGDWPFLSRESRVGLSPSAYLVSKFLVQSVTLFIATGLYLLTSVPLALGMEALSQPPGWRLALVWPTALSGAAIGLTLSALVRKPLASVLGIPVLLIPAVLLGGLLKQVVDMPPLVEALAAIDPLRWAFPLVLPEGWAAPLFGAAPGRETLAGLAVCIAAPLLLGGFVLSLRLRGRG